MRRSLLLVLLGACATASPVSPMPAPPPPAPPPPAPPPPAPVPPSPLGAATPSTLALGQRLALGGGVTVHVTDLVVEAIEGSPDGAYPAGSGVTLALVFEGLGAPQRRQISLLSAGYSSVSEAWFDRYRVTVVDVKDPLRAPQVQLVAERITDRLRPGTPVAARIERGAQIPLGAATMTFHGHTTKHIERGDLPPLMVAVEYRAADGSAERREYNVGADDRPQRWSWRDYRFTIVGHAHDEWMQLAIERLELEPL